MILLLLAPLIEKEGVRDLCDKSQVCTKIGLAGQNQKEVFRVQILRPADIFLTFPWGYIGVLGLYGTRATSALTSIRQNLIFFSLKGRYGQKGEIRIP